MFLSFLFGITSSLASAVIWHVMGDMLQGRLAGSNFSIAGVWVTLFQPASPSDSVSIEVLTIKHCRDHVRFHLENHNDARGTVISLKGMGIYRSSQFSAVYYFSGTSKPDTGTFVLRSRSSDNADALLSGVATQFIDREETGPVKVWSMPYRIIRIRIPLQLRLRRLLRNSYFQTYEEAYEWLSDVGAVKRLQEIGDTLPQ